MPSTRRQWIRQSLLSSMALGLLPTATQHWLGQQAAAADAAISPTPPPTDTEWYWRTIAQQFPLQEGLQYFNNGSLGPSPHYVMSLAQAYRETLEAYPSKYMWSGWKEEKEAVRQKAAQLMGCHTDEIALTHNTTEGMNLVASSLELAPGDEVILANHEHHTGTIPWQYYKESKGIKLVRPELPLLPESAEQLVSIYQKAISRKTKVISLVHMTNTNGMLLPIKAISQMAHERGITVLVDAAQTLGMVPLNVHELGCDFLAASGHKWLFGPKGTGIFYARKEAQDKIKPMIVCYGYDQASARRFENYNTRNLPDVLALGAALDFQETLGTQRKAQRILELKHYFRNALEQDSRFIFKTPAPDNLSAGIQVVEVAGKKAGNIKQRLVEDFQTDCRAMGSHNLNALRISLSVFNTKSQVDGLVANLQSLA